MLTCDNLVNLGMTQRRLNQRLQSFVLTVDIVYQFWKAINDLFSRLQ